MPHARVSGIGIYYETHGEGEALSFPGGVDAGAGPGRMSAAGA